MSTAMIWGASGGIGRSLAEKLKAGGWDVIAMTRQPARVEDLSANVVEADISDPYQVELAITTASQMVNEVDLWVYAIGEITMQKIDQMKPEQWSCILNANLTGAFLTTYYSLPLLSDQAHLFYLGAVSERLRLPGLGAYAATKAGLEAFVETLAKEQRTRNITIVRPGAVDTPFWDKVPIRLPLNALPPEAIASQIIEAYHGKRKGVLDIAPK